MEKFWVDMNNLTVTPRFFDKVASSWPKLRTLDLYDNNIHVDVAHVMKLKSLPQMQQLLLQNNRIYGRMDSNFFDGWSKIWTRLNMNINRDLEGCLQHVSSLPMTLTLALIEGCLHPSSIPPWLELSIGGTQIMVSSACDQHGVDYTTYQSNLASGDTWWTEIAEELHRADGGSGGKDGDDDEL